MSVSRVASKDAEKYVKYFYTSFHYFAGVPLGDQKRKKKVSLFRSEPGTLGRSVMFCHTFLLSLSYTCML